MATVQRNHFPRALEIWLSSGLCLASYAHLNSCLFFFLGCPIGAQGRGQGPPGDFQSTKLGL